MKKEIVIVSIMISTILSGCFFGDKVYHSKYKVLLPKHLNEEMSLCSRFKDPNSTQIYICKLVEQSNFKAKGVVFDQQSDFNVAFFESSCGGLHIIWNQNKTFIEFFSWNPGPYEGHEIKQTKLHEKSLIDELKQQECLQIEKVD